MYFLPSKLFLKSVYVGMHSSNVSVTGIFVELKENTFSLMVWNELLKILSKDN